MTAQKKDDLGIDWHQAGNELADRGHCLFEGLLAPDQCAQLIAMYEKETLFRTKITMARHNFGKGEYQYFAYPLPPAVAHLRERLYGGLVPIANRWAALMKQDRSYPETLNDYLEHCHAKEQTRPTPLILK